MAQNKHMKSLLDYSSDEIRNLVNLADELKKGRLKSDPNILKGRTAVLIFEKPSLRTRITFETAVNELGGHPINLESTMVQMGKRESVEDVARNLNRWVHLIIYRTFSHKKLELLADHAGMPVINALTDSYHPCQALALALTIKENIDTTKKVKVSFIGDANNVSASIMIMCAKLGYDFALASPEGYDFDEELVKTCKKIGDGTGSKITLTKSPAEAVNNASIIYTDVWTSMGQEAESKKRLNDFKGFQVNSKLLSNAPKDVKISHCLPAHRDEEISGEVLDSNKSLIFDEAENRLHVQKAVIVNLFS